MTELNLDQIDRVCGAFITIDEPDLWIPSQLSNVTTIAALDGRGSFGGAPFVNPGYPSRLPRN